MINVDLLIKEINKGINTANKYFKNNNIKAKAYPVKKVTYE